MRAAKIFLFWFVIVMIVDAPLLFWAKAFKMSSSLNGLFGLISVVTATILTKKKIRSGWFGESLIR